MGCNCKNKNNSVTSLNELKIERGPITKATHFVLRILLSVFLFAIITVLAIPIGLYMSIKVSFSNGIMDVTKDISKLTDMFNKKNKEDEHDDDDDDDNDDDVLDESEIELLYVDDVKS
jgi:hypothetical protein